MSDRPILMSAPMVRALLDGRKSQTRRLAWRGIEHQWIECEHGYNACPICSKAQPTIWQKVKVGDRLFPAMPVPSLGRRYCADMHGRIWSRARDGETWSILKGSPNSRGYLTITPAIDGKYPTRAVHRLVAETYYPDRPAKFNQVRHLNGKRTDNTPENLDWGTQEDNWSDRLAHGNGVKEKHHAAKLTQKAVAEIRQSTAPQRTLARHFGVSQSTIWGIRSGQLWQDSPTANPPNMPRWASRITLVVTETRRERVQEISEEDAKTEGMEPFLSGGPLQTTTEPGFEYRVGFTRLWHALHGPGSWEVNPEVVALTFTVHQCNIDEMEAAA